MDNERLIAQKYKRLAAFLLDFVLVFMLWYFMTKGNLKQVDTLMETLDPAVDGALDVFVQALFQMLTAFLLKWLFWVTARPWGSCFCVSASWMPEPWTKCLHPD